MLEIASIHQALGSVQCYRRVFIAILHLLLSSSIESLCLISPSFLHLMTLRCAVWYLAAVIKRQRYWMLVILYAELEKFT